MDLSAFSWRVFCSGLLRLCGIVLVRKLTPRSHNYCMHLDSSAQPWRCVAFSRWFPSCYLRSRCGSSVGIGCRDRAFTLDRYATAHARCRTVFYIIPYMHPSAGGPPGRGGEFHRRGKSPPLPDHLDTELLRRRPGQFAEAPGAARSNNFFGCATNTPCPQSDWGSKHRRACATSRYCPCIRFGVP